MGVEVRTNTLVTDIDADGVTCSGERLTASTVLWAAGVRGSPLCQRVGLEVDRQGRARVLTDCSVPGRPEVFVVGDAAAFIPTGQTQALPGVSPVAMQQGRFVARQIERSLNGEPREAFAYVDKGSMATIGRKHAVAQIRGLRLSGFLAWFAWLFVHIFYLIDFRNRVVVLLDWTWAYVAYRRGSRLITGRRLHAGAPAPVVQAPQITPATAPTVLPAHTATAPGPGVNSPGASVPPEPSVPAQTFGQDAGKAPMTGVRPLAPPMAAAPAPLRPAPDADRTPGTSRRPPPPSALGRAPRAKL
jgi:NADH dehydrogenase